MATVTAQELDKARNDMLREGYTQQEVDDAIEPFVAQLEAEAADVPAAISQASVSSPKEARRTIRILGPMLGGVALGGLGARAAASPAVARGVESISRPFVRGAATAGIRASQAAGEFAGQMAGDVGARELTGTPQSLPESAVTAGIGTGTGAGFRAVTRGIAGYLGGVPRASIQEAGIPVGGVLPNLKKISRPAPTTPGQVRAGISAEGRLADKVRGAVNKLRSKVTPQRQRKVQILRNADAAGVRIDVEPILQRIIDLTPEMRAEPSTAAFARHLDRFANNLVDEVAKRGGKLTPSQLDTFIRTNLAPKSFTAAGAPAQTRVGPVIREIKHLSTELLNNNLPPEARKLNAEISDYLSKAEDAEALFSEEKSGVINRLRDIYKPGNEENAQSLEFLSSEVDKSLSKEASNISTRRSFTTDPRERSQGAGAFSAKVARPFEAVGQVMAPFQAFAGPAAGGLQAAGITPFPSQDIVQMIADLLEAYRRPTPLRQEE